MNNRKIIIVIPGGTSPQIEILLNNLSREVNNFDECHLWLNTSKEERISYMLEMGKRFPFVKCVPRDFVITNQRDIIEGIGLFMDKCHSDDIYIRLDNDICFIEQNAIKKLVNYRIKNKNLFLAFANIINNPFTYYMYQKKGIIDFNKDFQLSYTNEGRNSSEVMLKMHNQFLTNPEPALYHFDSYAYKSQDLQVPVNVISWFGNDLGKFGKVVGNEEIFLNSRSGVNGICGDAVFCHLSYATQRVDCNNRLDILNITDRYLELSRRDQKIPMI